MENSDPYTNWKPARTLAECNAILTAPGAPFELTRGLVDGRVVKHYKNLPAKSLREFWLNTKLNGDKPYLVYEDERYSYAQAHKLTVQIANLLQDLGLVKGDRVSLVCRNYPEWVLIFWACHLLGVAPVAVNSWVSAEQMAHCIANSGSKLVVVDPDRAVELQEHLSLGLPEVESVLLLRTQKAPCSLPLRLKVRMWKEVEGFSESEIGNKVENIELDDLCAIYYTSGTTGLPKGVPCTNRMYIHGILNGLIAGVRAILRRGELPVPPSPNDPQKAALLAAPLFHVTGSQNLLPVATFIGAKIVLMYKWDPLKAKDILIREKITSIGGVTFLARSLIDAGVSEKDCMLEGLSFGGSPVAPSVVADSARAFPSSMVAQAWGMTEYFTIAVSQAGEDFIARPASTGLPNPVTELIVVDPSTLHEVPTGTAGELWLRGPSGAKEYWNQPDATASAFTKDGWYRTGDIGYVDTEGFVYISDRLKDLIIRGGENIPSIDVESVILQDPGVSECAAVAIPHATLGEEVAILVARKPGAKVSSELLHKLAAKGLKPMWRPRFILVQDEEIVKNANGKLDKKIIRDFVRKAWAREGSKTKL
ncbi:AMP-dependent synthetase and ligase [Meredithblackwellia eburnea MCA 4105]